MTLFTEAVLSVFISVLEKSVEANCGHVLFYGAHVLGCRVHKLAFWRIQS